jgi:hypothetical protein
MKIKVVKPAIIGLFLIFIMFGSTIAYSILQSVRFGETTEAELPKENIINYKLIPELKNLLLRQGRTVITYEYNLMCDNCLEQKNFLEQMVSSDQFKRQLFLEEVLSNSTEKTMPNIIIFSAYNQRILSNATQDEIIDALCEVVISPPVGCTLRKV